MVGDSSLFSFGIWNVEDSNFGEADVETCLLKVNPPSSVSVLLVGFVGVFIVSFSLGLGLKSPFLT